MLKFTATLAALSMMAFATQAATVSQSATPTSALANPAETSHLGDYYENITNPSVGGVYRSPWDDSGIVNGVYSSINGELTFAFSGLKNALSLVWGSPDSYNSIEFYLNGLLVDSLSGAAITPCCQSGQLNIANSLVSITDIGKLGVFDSIKLLSGQPAFEFANLTASDVSPVPVPAAGLLLAGGLGALAAARRRRRAA